MISIFAPDGIGEVGDGSDLPAMIAEAVAGDPSGPLRDGDIVVVTSKIISKAEGRRLPAQQREAAIAAESTGTVARRGAMRIVRTRQGLTIAAAGVDNSNVEPESILLLPADPDASAAELRRALRSRYGLRVGVIISDTAGRAWRIGQTDHAIGASGVRVIDRYEGRIDPYGNDLQVTAIAVADELAAAADLAKSKLAGRPVAVIRGLSTHLSDSSVDTAASDLVRPAQEDLFGRGAREAVLEATLAAYGQADRFEQVIDRPDAALATAVVDAVGAVGDRAELIRAVIGAAVSGATHPASTR
ncbi:MAG TPA: coenzyme F420-0:L-glutamate ligase [Propionibacteriaceae bacterium]|nr:coenzyme F420-0:L-glutamate ligase [Propionibacteriaceae bacterium]